MDEYTASTYGDRVADIYDDWYPPSSRAGDVEAAVAFLRGLAGAGPALELGIGTGRVALPLQRGGVQIHGIDASDAMLAKLGAKDGGTDIVTSHGNFRDFELEERFAGRLQFAERAGVGRRIWQGRESVILCVGWRGRSRRRRSRSRTG